MLPLLLLLVVVRKKVICTNVCLLSFGRLHCTVESLLHQPGSSSYILMRRRFALLRVCVCVCKHRSHFVGTECGFVLPFALDNSRRRGSSSPSLCQYQIS
uniref:Putative secreted peptide n=1 Tax=Anopheles braziliensis TaxID=58242 RepID=A0A2M3ZX70_9DIPT